MAKNTSILLGEHFEKFISDEVSSGRYTSASEVVRSALRLLESKGQRKKQLVNALKKGERSKSITDYNAANQLENLHKKYL